MKSKLIILFTILLMSYLAPLIAQNANISGKIIQMADKSPVKFANVLLLTPDSIYLSGVSSDEQGFFEMKNIPSGKYLVLTSCLNYMDMYEPITLNDSDYYTEIILHNAENLLEDVVITARAVVNKPDRKLIVPLDEQIKTSSDGVELLGKLQLPRIMVDPVGGEVSVSGNGEMQLRINGVQVTNIEVASLDPGDIIRIEYHDNPGVRYGSAAAVIDYITRRKETGGNIMGNFMHNIGGDRTSADDMFSAKYNYGKSELSVNARFQQRKGEWTREYDEKFLYPDREIHRLEVGEPTLFNKKALYMSMNYSLMEKGNYFFNAQFRYNYLDFPAAYTDRKGLLYTSENDKPLWINDHSTEKTNSPALDLYYQHNLTSNQLIILNLVGTYISTKSHRRYQEKRNEVYETDIYTNVTGSKYSLIAEGIFEKNIENSKLIAGIKHMQTYTDNQYRDFINTDVNLKQAETSVYAEYQGRPGKWGYMANVAVSRFYYSQHKNHTEEYTVQPSARLTFDPNRNLYFRYRIDLKNNMPLIAYLNDVEQAIDVLQLRRGNPNLSIYRTLNQSFAMGYSKGILGLDLLIMYDYQHKPIMETVLLEDDKFIRTYENQHSFENLSAEVAIKIKPWKNYITVSLAPKLNRYISTGNNYLHTYNMKEIRVNLDLTYKNWVANFTTVTPPDRYVYGEQLLKGQIMHTLTAGYKTKQWALMAGIHNPFIKEYRAYNENWSALNPVRSEIHSTNMTRTFLVKFNFNIGYGKQTKATKLINNTDNETGIISGSKN